MNKGDRVSFQGRVGTVQNRMPNGMVDVRFDDVSHVERRAENRLALANPRKPRPARRSIQPATKARKNPHYAGPSVPLETGTVLQLPFSPGSPDCSPDAWWTVEQELAVAAIARKIIDNLPDSTQKQNEEKQKLLEDVKKSEQAIALLLTGSPGQPSDVRRCSDGEVICHATLASFDLASRKVRGKQVDPNANELQLTPANAMEVFRYIQEYNDSDVAFQRRAYQKFKSMGTAERQNVYSQLGAAEIGEDKRRRDALFRQVVDESDREQARLKRQLYIKPAEEIESDVQRIVSRERAAFFTREDPPRMSEDGRVYCGNPVDGVAYYLVVDKSRRWDAPFVKWDQIYDLARKMFKDELSSLVEQQVTNVQPKVSTAPLAQAARVAREEKDKAEQRLEDARQQLDVAELQYDLEVFAARYAQPANPNAVRDMNRLLPEKIDKAVRVITDKRGRTSPGLKVVALKFLAEFGDDRALPAVAELANRQDPTGQEILVRSAQEALGTMSIRALNHRILKLRPFLNDRQKRTLAEIIGENDRAKTVSWLDRAEGSLEQNINNELQRLVNKFVQDAREQAIEDKISSLGEEKRAEARTFEERKRAYVTPEEKSAIRTRVMAQDESYFRPTELEKSQLRNQVIVSLKQNIGSSEIDEVPQLFSLAGAGDLTPEARALNQQQLAEARDLLDQATDKLGLALWNYELAAYGLNWQPNSETARAFLSNNILKSALGQIYPRIAQVELNRYFLRALGDNRLNAKELARVFAENRSNDHEATAARAELDNAQREHVQAQHRFERALAQPFSRSAAQVSQQLNDAVLSARRKLESAITQVQTANREAKRAEGVALEAGLQPARTIKDIVKEAVDSYCKSRNAVHLQDAIFNRAVVTYQKKVDDKQYAEPFPIRMDSKAIDLVPARDDRISVSFPSIELMGQMAEAFASFMGKMEHKSGVRIIPILPRHRAYIRVRKAKHYSARGTTPRAELTGKQPKAEPAGREPNFVDDFASPTEGSNNLTYYIQSGWVAPGYTFLNSFEFYDYKTFNVRRDCTLLSALQEGLPCGESIARALIASGAVSTNPFLEGSKTVAIKGYPMVNIDPESRLIGPKLEQEKPFAGARVAVWLRDKADSPFFSWTYTNTPITTSTKLAPCLSADELELRNQLGMLRRAFQQLDNGFSQVRALFKRLAENPSSLKTERDDPNKLKRKLPDGTFTEVSRPQFASDARRALMKIANGYVAIDRWFSFFNAAKGRRKGWAQQAEAVLRQATEPAVPCTIWFWDVERSEHNLPSAQAIKAAEIGKFAVVDGPAERVRLEVTVPSVHAASAGQRIQEILDQFGVTSALKSRPAVRGASFRLEDLRKRWTQFRSDTRIECAACAGSGTEASGVPCGECNGIGTVTLDFGLIAPGGRTSDIGDAAGFNRFMDDYHRKLLKNVVPGQAGVLPIWSPESADPKKRTVSALRWLGGDGSVTPVDDLYAYGWRSLPALTQDLLKQQRKKLLEDGSLQAFYTAAPELNAKNFSAFLELVSGRYQKQAAEQQQKLLNVEQFITTGADLGAGGVRMNIRADRESADPWERIGVAFGDPTRPARPPDTDIARWLRWVFPPPDAQGRRREPLVRVGNRNVEEIKDQLTEEVSVPGTVAYQLFEQWKMGRSSDERRLRGIAKATWTEERGAKQEPFERINFMPPSGVETKKVPEDLDQNWALGFLLTTVFPALRDTTRRDDTKQEKHQQQVRTQIRDLILLMMVYYDLGGYAYAGPLDGNHPFADFKPDEITGTHLIDRMVNFLGAQEAKVAGGSSGLGQGSNFTVYLTYNPVLFEVTRLYWRTDNAFLFNHPEVIRDIDTVGRYGEAAMAVQKAAITSTSQDEVFQKLQGMLAPAVRLKPTRENLTLVLRGPTKKRGQAREQRPVGPDEMTMRMDEGKVSKIQIGVDPMGEAIGHFETFALLWPLGVSVETARQQAVEFATSPISYLTTLKREGVDPALARVRSARTEGVLEESGTMPAPPDQVKSVLDRLELGTLEIDPVSLSIQVTDDTLERLKDLDLFPQLNEKPKERMTAVLMHVLNSVKEKAKGTPVSSDEFFLTVERFVAANKFRLPGSTEHRPLYGREVNAILNALPAVAHALGTLVDTEPETRAYLRTAATTYLKDSSVVDPQLTEAQYREKLRNRGLDERAQTAVIQRRASNERDLLQRLHQEENQRGLLNVRTGRIQRLFHIPAALGLDRLPLGHDEKLVNFADTKALENFVGSDPEKLKQMVDWIAAGLPCIELVTKENKIQPRMITVPLTNANNQRMAFIALEAMADLAGTEHVRVGQQNLKNPFFNAEAVDACRELLKVFQGDTLPNEIQVMNVVRPSVRPVPARPRYDRSTVGLLLGRQRKGQRTLPMPVSVPPAFDERKYTRSGLTTQGYADYRWTGQQAIHPHSALEKASAVEATDKAIVEELVASEKYINAALRQAEEALSQLVEKSDPAKSNRSRHKR